jgi:hypothetical protein
MYVIRHRQPNLNGSAGAKGRTVDHAGMHIQKAAECGAYDVCWMSSHTNLGTESINGDIARRSALKLGYAAACKALDNKVLAFVSAGPIRDPGSAKDLVA